MNFLEQLAAEWYEYKGYFVRTNIKFEKRKAGGYTGELDVVAYKPDTKDFIHIECSTDSSTWKDRQARFRKKFFNADRNYKKLFPFHEKELVKIAIVGFHKDRGKFDFGPNVTIILIPDFIQKITNELKNKNPMQDAIPESYPLLRAIQYSAFFNK